MHLCSYKPRREKSVFGISDQVQQKSQKMVIGLKFRILEVERLYYLYSKTKVQISCTVTLQLICTFVFAYSKSRFSHDAAHLSCFPDLIHEQILPDRDIKMKGKVTWAGKTSMEITMELDQVQFIRTTHDIEYLII